MQIQLAFVPIQNVEHAELQSVQMSHGNISARPCQHLASSVSVFASFHRADFHSCLFSQLSVVSFPEWPEASSEDVFYEQISQCPFCFLER